MDFVVIFDKRNFKFSKPLAIIPANLKNLKRNQYFKIYVIQQNSSFTD